ncbi:hypothetical protein [Paracoccus halophilus]|nr:hypothetical protein [Paracoccus halophilus]
MTGADASHDPTRRSWIKGADDAGGDFPIQNLPFGAFSVAGGPVHIGVAIGRQILDLTVLERQGLLRPGGDAEVFRSGILNPFMALPPRIWTGTRHRIADLLDRNNAPPARSQCRLRQAVGV